MRASFYGFESVRKALMVSQKGIDITGQNVSNLNTEGYTRQRLDISSLSLESGTTRYARPKGEFTGQGADVTGITQTRDQFLDTRFRKELAEFGKYDSKLLVMTDIENVIDEASTSGLSDKLGEFYNQLKSFSLNCESVEFASIFRSSAQKVVEIFNQYSSMLSDVKEEHVFNLETQIDDVNNTVKKIAELNKQIKGEFARNGTPNELLDVRNLYLDKISHITGASYEFKANGEVSIKIGDNYILDSEKNNYTNKLSLNSAGYPLQVTLNTGETPKITNGSLKGYLEGLNGKDVFADPLNPSDDRSKGLPYFMQSLDKLATSFAENFNQLNDPTGVNKLFEGDAMGNITAGSIKLSQDWIKDAQYITKSTVIPIEEGRNDNLLKMLASMSEKRSITPYFKGTFEEHSVSLIGDMSVEVSYNKDMTKTTEFIVNTIGDQRESIMGVSIDEEGINMVKFQKSYNAAARIMTTMDEMLDTLISRTGVVGR